MSEEGEHGIGRFASGLRNENGNRLVRLLSATTFSWQLHLHEEGTPAMDTGVTQKIKERSRKLEKKLSPCRRRREIVYDGVRLEELLATCDSPIKEDLTKDYGLLLRGLRVFGKMPQCLK
ncbi:unnamed protein product [Strongylus vulgaris]|uniref:Uncharacterized protein n=1 Tax=Strongylus vulgaris TaxID=40348 RepID=A0A3P7KJC3_STRVU|nr:unnamed protein product [Strongylus vulgaris]